MKNITNPARSLPTRSLLGSMILFLAAFGCVNAQTKEVPKADSRVAQALRETNTEFELSSKDGIYKVTYGTKGKRTQAVHVASVTEDINGDEMRLIFSFVSISKGLPTHQISNMLLEDNLERIGRWALQKLDDNNYALLNMLHVPANLKGKKLETAMMSTAVQADEMEDKLTKKDEH